MDKGYIAPETALKKLRTARSLGQTVYIYGATGYGKTELVKQYLKNRKYWYVSCGEDTAVLTTLAEDAPSGMPNSRKENRKGKKTKNVSRTVIVLDDVQLLKNVPGRRAALAIVGREDIWLILICRSPLPSWLMPPYMRSGFIVITEDDLCFGE